MVTEQDFRFETRDGADDDTRLVGDIQIAGARFHVTAIAVNEEEDEFGEGSCVQTAVSGEDSEELGQLYEFVGQPMPFTSVVLSPLGRPRAYVLFITPTEAAA